MVLFHQKTNTEKQTERNQATERIIEKKEPFFLLNIFDYARKLITKRIYTNYYLSLGYYLLFLLSQCTLLFVEFLYFFVKYLSKNKTKCYFKNFKSFLFIFFLSSLGTISAGDKNSSDQNKTLNCARNLEKKLFYDENLFTELKMNETLINLYRSCYKDLFQDYKFSHVVIPNPGQEECYINQIEPNHILYELIFNKKKNLIPQTVLNRIDLVCNKNQLTDLDRAFYLIEYEHPICGNIFKNSVKNSHLKDYIFRDNHKLKRSNNLNSVSNRHHHNRYRFFPLVMSKNSYSTSNNSDPSTINEDPKPQSNNLNPQNTHLNNCSLILLNVYLLSNSASCSFNDFIESLNHFDCLSNYFSVNSNCKKCQVKLKFFLFFFNCQ